jgi:hypothetical protein
LVYLFYVEEDLVKNTVGEDDLLFVDVYHSTVEFHSYQPQLLDISGGKRVETGMVTGTELGMTCGQRWE